MSFRFMTIILILVKTVLLISFDLQRPLVLKTLPEYFFNYLSLTFLNGGCQVFGCALSLEKHFRLIVIDKAD